MSIDGANPLNQMNQNQARGTEGADSGADAAAQFENIMDENFKHGMALLAMQQKAHRQNEAISMQASIEKSRHDASQAVIQKT